MDNNAKQNPFEYLKIAREEQERRIHEESATTRKHEEEKISQRDKVCKSINKMVCKILDQLMEANYPHLRRYDESIGIGREYRWTIGSTMARGDTETWDALISVYLQFDENNKPYLLVRKEWGKSIRVGLSSEELVQALKELR
jgi:hypothetical protein